ncbi:S-adenosyl-L-methionine-dependent methyltransferase [Xylaria venustula]|nr:S-adenosyl-L-methionine-dependent methyltransferase [Xylaria venustula]
MTTTEIRSLPVKELYSRWGTSYDQGRVNNMQGLDDTEMETLLPKFLSWLQQSNDASASTLKVVDFGCGTGRNTLKLVATLPGAEIVGLDATPALLEVAERRCNEVRAAMSDDKKPKSLSFVMYNPLEDDKGRPPPIAAQAQGLISNLVVEHLPLSAFFQMCNEIIAPGGCVLVTNTHEDLARIAHGSIVDPQSGEKLWSDSHIHTNEAVKSEGAKWGFELVELQEGIPKDPNMVGAMRGHWDGVKCWVGFLLVKQK